MNLYGYAEIGPVFAHQSIILPRFIRSCHAMVAAVLIASSLAPIFT
jgi:hypothetical protein